MFQSEVFLSGCDVNPQSIEGYNIQQAEDDCTVCVVVVGVIVAMACLRVMLIEVLLTRSVASSHKWWWGVVGAYTGKEWSYCRYTFSTEQSSVP